MVYTSLYYFLACNYSQRAGFVRHPLWLPPSLPFQVHQQSLRILSSYPKNHDPATVYRIAAAVHFLRLELEATLR